MHLGVALYRYIKIHRNELCYPGYNRLQFANCQTIFLNQLYLFCVGAKRAYVAIATFK